jgi:hypothetical protein
MTVALFVAASTIAPFVLLRRRALWRWLAIEAGAWLLLGALAALIRPFGARLDIYLALVTFGVCLTGAFWAFVAATRPFDLRWSATRAAVTAALFYAVAVPLMMRTPIDGDEPYYLLITESIVHDHDLDLANQYRDLARSRTGRTDLVPQLGDRAGPHGQSFSHHELLLPLLLIAGYLIGGLPGAIAVIALFAVLLARSTVRLFEDEGIDDETIRALFPLIAFGPPIVFYAARIWPEVPAAFCFVEAVRGIRQRRGGRWIPALLGLVLLKLRFLLIAIVLLLRLVWDRRSRLSAAPVFIAALLVAIPVLIVWPTTVHTWREWIPGAPLPMLRGLFGLMLDGTAGILFHAPIYCFGLIALVRWRVMPGGFRLGMSAAALYILYLVGRPEWHGGWSPPLRYIVVFMPILALGCAALWDRIAAGAIVCATAWTMVIVAHGMTYPWRLFHIANGENFIGETLSMIWQSDFSRLFPSFIRPNFAAIVAGVVAIVVVVVAMWRGDPATEPVARLITPAVLALIMATAFVAGRKPGDRIEFEDAHVVHRGGELFPQEYQVARFAFVGGWIVRGGDALSVLAKGGGSMLHYSAAVPSVIQIDQQAYTLPATGSEYGDIPVHVDHDGRIELRCLSGVVNLDRMDHE